MGSRSERILLTGSGGFTGRPLAERLRREGHEVIGITRHEGEGGQFAGDLCVADWTKGVVAQINPTVVLHLAGITTMQHADAGEIYAVNVTGTVNLLAALAGLAAKPRRVVIASTGTIYAARPDGAPIAEDSAVRPANHYAMSKWMSEEAAGLYRDRLPILVTRPFNYTGPGQSTTFLVPKIVDHFVRKAPEIQLGNLDLHRDISDVERVIEVYARLVEVVDAPPVVNICSGRTILLRDIVSLLEEISGHRIKVTQNPALMRKDEVRTLQGSAARLTDLVGALPDPDLRTTLRRMYEAGRAAQISNER